MNDIFDKIPKDKGPSGAMPRRPWLLRVPELEGDLGCHDLPAGRRCWSGT